MDQNTPPTGSRQLAQVMFEDFAPLCKSIADVPAEIGFTRNNLLVTIDDVSLSTRKALDAAYFIVSQESTTSKSFSVDINFFHWLMAYSSRNRNHFRAILLEAQRSIIQVDYCDPTDEKKEKWRAVQLLGAVDICQGKLTFEVHESLQRAIQSPKNSHFFSLRLSFSSLHAKILHDRLLPYVAQGHTPWIEIQELRRQLGCTTKTFDQFKYLKRDVLELAIHQINSQAPIEVSYETRSESGTKKIRDIRFRIKSRQMKADPMGPMIVLKELYETLSEEIGLSSAQFAEIISNRDKWTDLHIRKAVEYTRFSIRRGKVNRSVSGFFMRALKDGYNVGSADLALLSGPDDAVKVGKEPATYSEGVIKDTFQKHLAHQEKLESERVKDVTIRGMELYSALDEYGQQEMLEAFSQTPTAKSIAARTKTSLKTLATLIADNDWMRKSLGIFMLEKEQQKLKGSQDLLL